MQDSCEIEITGMQITIQPKKRVENGSSMLESMWTSMASSMQLAEECLKSGDLEDEKEASTEDLNSSISGLEHCAQAIDAGEIC
jgi:autophagy-related protein 2